MRLLILTIGLLLSGAVNGQNMKPLTPEERRVIVDKGTEAPFTGRYYDHREAGVYHCRQCGAPLYRSADKFDAGCGWPSFDDEIPGAVMRTPDADGRRTEITCAKCGAHLGHVFVGEEFTPKNTRHCVNSVSLLFEPEAKAGEQPAAGGEQAQKKEGPETAIFAGGCFWGVEYLLSKMPGDGQGPDLGDQYRSEIFYTTPAQQQTAEKLIGELRRRGYDVVTEVTPAGRFWPAEDYHQQYYKRKGTLPYCHAYTKRF